MTKIRIGTRNSQLAMWQAHMVADQLRTGGFEPELFPMVTKGDKILDRTLSKIGSKGVFTEELESGLLNGDLDIAVHSAKDMPSSLPEGLELISFGARETVNDVVVSFDNNFSWDNPGIIGTSSTRRVAMLKHYYPQAQIVDMRGNLQTRFQKMKDGQCDAMLLAYAGVHRMEMDEVIQGKLPIDTFTPPTGQGSVTIEACPARLAPEILEGIIACTNDTNAALAVRAERAYLARMDGGCSIPTFAHAQVIDDTITMQAGIVSLDGSELIRKEAKGTLSQGIEIAEQLAKEVLENGGERILKEIKAASA